MELASKRNPLYSERKHTESNKLDDSDISETISLGSRQSSATTGTFRDTEIEDDLASYLMKMQSLTSIVNDPKGDSFLSKMQGVIGARNSLDYKPITEHQVAESYTLPKVSLKDFGEYLNYVREPYAQYAENHKGDKEEKRVNHKKRLSSVAQDPKLREVPSEYFNESYRLNKSMFQVQSNEQVFTLSDNLNKYLEIVEGNLVRNIQQNFDYFTDAFTNFDGMKEDMMVIQEKASSMRTHNELLKKDHLHKMLQVYHL